MSDLLTFRAADPAALMANRALERMQPRLGTDGTRAGDKPDPRLAAACAEFESLFLNQLFKEMRATIPKAGLIDGGNAEAIYTSLLDTELARGLAQRGGIGLAELTRASLDRSPRDPKP